VLRLVLPKGSLEKATFDLFEAADLTDPAVVHRVDYKAEVDDPRIDEVRILRPQEIPLYVAEGLFDLGSRPGLDRGDGADVVSLGELATRRPPATRSDGRGRRRRRRGEAGRRPAHGVRVSTEYPELTAASSTSRGVRPTSAVYGASEAKIPTSPTASSTSPRRAGACAPPGCA
jgi:ATP phosphoribosyltransferase